MSESAGKYVVTVELYVCDCDTIEGVDEIDAAGEIAERQLSGLDYQILTINPDTRG